MNSKERSKEQLIDIVPELQEWLYDKLKEWQKDLEPGQKLVISGTVSKEECDATINLVKSSKKRRKPVDRLLSTEELDKIGAVKDFNKKQREVVDFFLSSNNSPRIRRDMQGHTHHIEQINDILRKKGLAYGIYYSMEPGRAWKGSQQWDDQICFRPLE